jgi:putative tryptophan/tyrosine transport system substrate-binding protein
MRRRDFIRLTGLAATAWPLVAQSQQPTQNPRIGVLGPEAAGEPEILWDAFRDELHRLGYVEGKTIDIEYRFADNRRDALPVLARELVALKVDVIVTQGTGIVAAHNATTRIPIVAAAAGDMVALGMAASLAHPGGNVTGSSFLLPEIMSKRLDLLKQVVPSTTRVGVLKPGMGATAGKAVDAMGEVAKALHIELEPIEVVQPTELESAFSTWTDRQVGAVVLIDLPIRWVVTIADLAATRRLASIGQLEFAASGGLIGYGVDFPALWRRAAYFVDSILKGANASDIPVEQATKFKTIFNLKTAKTLGLEIPPTLLAAADEVIE